MTLSLSEEREPESSSFFLSRLASWSARMYPPTAPAAAAAMLLPPSFASPVLVGFAVVPSAVRWRRASFMRFWKPLVVGRLCVGGV